MDTVGGILYMNIVVRMLRGRDAEKEDDEDDEDDKLL